MYVAYYKRMPVALALTGVTHFLHKFCLYVTVSQETTCHLVMLWLDHSDDVTNAYRGQSMLSVTTLPLTLETNEHRYCDLIITHHTIVKSMLFICNIRKLHYSYVCGEITPTLAF